MTNLNAVAEQIEAGERVDVDALREAGHAELATLIEDQIDDDTDDETRKRVVAAVRADATPTEAA